ncbi:hypothetical protein JCM17845_06840 [Iodidimonas gelatinilytica]|uniref:Methyl-accepting chemotaxis protein n=1 Tax=Iodidimonas gelatinilytica TaxID=1236966 RepID=A0A5A7MVM3_9PROT|nr:methyl-accepting chemotaxis protein [Iodidimonas gelatinilytica]GER00061.1 hypothetical protein JCM17845_06840 [Iodidimonas gelatinilytica]
MWKIGNWLSNQKFGIRLALGFSTIGVLMLFMGAFSVNGAFTLSAVTENLHRHPYTVSNATRDVQTAIYAIHRDMKDIALSRDPSEIETAMASINQHEKNALEAFDIIEKRFLGDKTDIEEAKKAFLSWKPIRDRAIDRARNGDYESAARITRETDATFMQTLFSEIDEVVAFASNKGIEFMEQANGTRTKTLWSISIFILATFAAGAAIAVFSSKNITHPLNRLREVMENLAGGDLTVKIPFNKNRDEIGDMARTVEIFQQNAIAKAQAEAEAKEAAEQLAREEAERKELEAEQQAREREEAETIRRRAQALDTLVQKFEQQVSEITNALSTASTEMSSTAENLTDVADGTARRAEIVRGAGEEASQNVTTAASAAEELTAAVAEISRQVANANSIAGEASEQVQSSTKNVEALSVSADRVGEVVTLINAIAEQTNLLALNATIEAARAGEAGKGFAVVASEVKSLASQTRNAIEEIGTLVMEIQSAGSEAASTMTKMNDVIAKVTEANSTIAAAVEQQSGATREIAENMQNASNGTVSVAHEINGVADGAAETGSAATQMRAAASSLSEMTTNLKTQIDQFIDGVKSV